MWPVGAMYRALVFPFTYILGNAQARRERYRRQAAPECQRKVQARDVRK